MSVSNMERDVAAQVNTVQKQVMPARDALSRGEIARVVADTALREYWGMPVARTVQDLIAEYSWLNETRASCVTLKKGGLLRGCIGTMTPIRPLGEDIAAHAVGAATNDPRFWPIPAHDYGELDIEVYVFGAPEIINVRSRDALEWTLRHEDGVSIDDGNGHTGAFLPHQWHRHPRMHEFVSHLLEEAGLPSDFDWRRGELQCKRCRIECFA